jgi:hypothetical protein
MAGRNQPIDPGSHGVFPFEPPGLADPGVAPPICRHVGTVVFEMTESSKNLR